MCNSSAHQFIFRVLERINKWIYDIHKCFDYFQAVAAFPQMAVPGNNVKEMISFVNDSGFGAIGTPDMVHAQIDRLWKQSNGGFGAYLLLAHNWAPFDATRRSYELIARHVAREEDALATARGESSREKAEQCKRSGDRTHGGHASAPRAHRWRAAAQAADAWWRRRGTHGPSRRR